MQLPYLKVQANPSGCEAIAAIRVNALLHSSLLIDSYYGKGGSGHVFTTTIDPRQLHHAREALLSAMSGWVDTTLEVRLAVVPDIGLRTQSLINLNYVLRCQAETPDLAREKGAARYLALMPLLASHVPEAACEPVSSMKDLDQVLTWLVPGHAISIQRRREVLSLAKPLVAQPIGFHSGNQRSMDSVATAPVVTHLFTWVPELDDWSRLLDALTCQIDPLLIIVRLRPL